MAYKRARPTTDTSAAPATIPLDPLRGSSLFNQFGDLERCSRRPGNGHSADDWEGVLKPVVVRYKGRKVRLYFRGDAAFASPEMHEYLAAEGFPYATRLSTNQVLQESIAHLLTRPVSRPPNHVRRVYASVNYQTGSWSKKRRVVATGV